MMHTHVQRIIRDYPEEISVKIQRLMPRGNYTVTGRPGYEYGESIVWEIDLWAVEDRELTLLDIVLVEYRVTLLDE